MMATNASCAIVIEDQADQAGSANDFTCNGVPKKRKTSAITDFFLQTVRCAVTVCVHSVPAEEVEQEPEPQRQSQMMIIDDKDVSNLVGKTLTQSEKYEALKSITVPPKDYKFPVREFKTRTGVRRRSFIYSWIGKYPGLAYSISQDGAYCLFCLLFVCDKNEHAVLIRKPYRDWKHATELFNGHYFDLRSEKKSSYGYETHKMCAESALTLQRVVMNAQRKFLSFRATPEVNFSALSPVHNVLPSRCPSPNKSAPRDIIVARVSAKAPDGFDAVSVQNVGSTYIIVSRDLPAHSNGILINFSLYCNGALYIICWTGLPVTPTGTALQLECGVGRHQCCSQPAQHEDSPPGGPPDPESDTNDIVISLFINKIINPDKSFGSSSDPMCILLPQLSSLLVEHTAPNIHDFNKCLGA
eukprot:Em0014g915a